MKPNRQKIMATLAALMLSTSVLTPLTSCDKDENKKSNIKDTEVVPATYQDFDFIHPFDGMDEETLNKYSIEILREYNNYGYIETPYKDNESKIHKFKTYGNKNTISNPGIPTQEFAILGCGEDSDAFDEFKNTFAVPYFATHEITSDERKHLSDPITTPMQIIDINSISQETQEYFLTKANKLCDKCFNDENDIKKFKEYISDTALEDMQLINE